MKKGEAKAHAYQILNQIITEYLEKNEEPIEVTKELHELMLNSAIYSDTVKDREYIGDYPVYDGDDVALCPRCHDQDITPGNRICTSCRTEIFLDTI